MPTSAFSVETNLIDRNDLNIYEKMCSVVLARYAGRAEFSNMLNINVIAIRMGCDVKEAEKALNSLIAKKLVTLEDAGTIEPELLVEPQKVSSRVIKSEGPYETSQAKAKAVEPLTFESLDVFEEEKEVKGNSKGADKSTKVEALEGAPVAKPKKTRKAAPKKASTPEAPTPKTITDHEEVVAEKTSHRPIVPKQVRADVQDLIDQVFEIIEENINDREARIILSFANNDIEQVREKYKIAKNSQVNDKIEMLINELQKRESPAAGVSKSPSGQEEMGRSRVTSLSPEESTKVLKNKQIDLDNINRMVALKQNSYGKQANKGSK